MGSGVCSPTAQTAGVLGTMCGGHVGSMRIAVLADIHGNMPALEAVLAEVEDSGVDRIVLLGDIAGGPMPAQTLDRLAGLGDKAIWVHGNGERELLAGLDGRVPAGPAGDTVAACVPLLDQRHRDLMTALPMTVSLPVDGLGPTLFCHATPRRDDELILVDSPISRWERVLEGIDEQIVVCGHTHMPFDRLVNQRRVVNPGSVGMAYGPAGAYWAVLGPTVELRRTTYDVHAAAERIIASGYPDAAGWASAYALRPYGDVAALEAFTAIIAAEPDAVRSDTGLTDDRPAELRGLG
ncbi:metallophosphoesterase family protein [Dactylosporangium roseum]|uniref:Metallophosphoesterase family protein n=1 Tax=Dactylosporangium roseum TaxID=47989 RepID=A0ABY5ZEN6_9ACTN|nr:metallophosphoesterase family protein [Dactylosporangium roseum]UWZ39222.1 metallophosphoesterase family protein [Dactylosporangium roseum]